MSRALADQRSNLSAKLREMRVSAVSYHTPVSTTKAATVWSAGVASSSASYIQYTEYIQKHYMAARWARDQCMHVKDVQHLLSL